MSSLARFIIEEGQLEIVRSTALAKHGTHDQSKHNPHKGGARALDPMRGYKAGEWTAVTDPAEAERLYIEASVAAYEQREGKPLEGTDKFVLDATLQSDGAVRAVREKELEGAEVFKNGSTLLIVKRSNEHKTGYVGGKRDPRGVTTDAEIQGLTMEIDRMQRDYPVAGLRVHIDNEGGGFVGKPNSVMYAYRGGASLNGEPHIFIKSSSMRSTGISSGISDGNDYWNPSTESFVNDRRIYLTHEWGHLLDAKLVSSKGFRMPYVFKDAKIQEVIDRVPNATRYMSAYGMTHPAEHFAEAFASYVIHKQKGWKMTNPLTLEMAKEFKW